MSDEEDEDGDDDEFALPEGCSELDVALGEDEFEGQTAESESETFLRGDLESGGTQVRLSATAVTGEDEDSVAETMDLMRDADLPQCLADGFAASFAELGEGIEFADIEVSSPELSDLGDEGVAFHLSTAFTVQGMELPV